MTFFKDFILEKFFFKLVLFIAIPIMKVISEFASISL